ncbi:hypothetical protein OH77DRAFT_1322449 [Trametes cingulata]|nr:hypothetical protein OH77DRAFT_1322449 [Trametes cingulata]
MGFIDGDPGPLNNLASQAIPLMTQLQELVIPVTALSKDLSLSRIASWWPENYSNPLRVIDIYAGVFEWDGEYPVLEVWEDIATLIRGLKNFPNLSILTMSDVGVPFPLQFQPIPTWKHTVSQELLDYLHTHIAQLQTAEETALHQFYQSLPSLQVICYQYLQSHQRAYSNPPYSFFYSTIAYRNGDSEIIIRRSKEAITYIEEHPELKKATPIKMIAFTRCVGPDRWAIGVW